MQCCPKSIKTTLNKNFSYVMLSGASQTTLHRFLTCTMLSLEYMTKLHKIFSYAMLSGTSQTTLHRVLTCAMLSVEHMTKLHKIFSYARLSGILVSEMMSYEY